MYNFDPIQDDGDTSADFCFRDYFLIMFFCVAMLLCVVLVLVNERKKDEVTDDKAPGSVIVELVWSNDRNVDLDLWVKAPGDDAVGYSSMSGKVFNLLRDDLGSRNDLSGVNLENAYSRGTPPGEYIVNVHNFNVHDGGGPTECTVIVRVKESPDSPAKQLVTTTLTLPSGKEDTAIRFKLTSDGKLVDGSLGSLFSPIRASRTGR